MPYSVFRTERLVSKHGLSVRPRLTDGSGLFRSVHPYQAEASNFSLFAACLAHDSFLVAAFACISPIKVRGHAKERLELRLGAERGTSQILQVRVSHASATNQR